MYMFVPMVTVIMEIRFLFFVLHKLSLSFFFFKDDILTKPKNEQNKKDKTIVPHYLRKTKSMVAH